MRENPFLFEAEDSETKSHFKDSFEFYENEFSDEAGEYEFEEYEDELDETQFEDEYNEAEFEDEYGRAGRSRNYTPRLRQSRPYRPPIKQRPQPRQPLRPQIRDHRQQRRYHRSQIPQHRPLSYQSRPYQKRQAQLRPWLYKKRSRHYQQRPWNYQQRFRRRHQPRYPGIYSNPYYSSRPWTTLGEPLPQNSTIVSLLQSLLNKTLGLNLPIDGVMDIETRSAIRSFQNQQDRAADTNSGSDAQPDTPTEQTPLASNVQTNPQSEFYEYDFEFEQAEINDKSQQLKSLDAILRALRLNPVGGYVKGSQPRKQLEDAFESVPLNSAFELLNQLEKGEGSLGKLFQYRLHNVTKAAMLQILRRKDLKQKQQLREKCTDLKRAIGEYRALLKDYENALIKICKQRGEDSDECNKFRFMFLEAKMKFDDHLRSLSRLNCT